MPALLRDRPQLPDEFSHLIVSLGNFGPPIDWAQLESWSRMTGRNFARWEIDVLAHIDRKRQQ